MVATAPAPAKTRSKYRAEETPGNKGITAHDARKYQASRITVDRFYVDAFYYDDELWTARPRITRYRFECLGSRWRHGLWRLDAAVADCDLPAFTVRSGSRTPLRRAIKDAIEAVIEREIGEWREVYIPSTKVIVGKNQ